MRTKSIRLTEEEEAALRQYVQATGEVEATALKRAAMRGLREMRLEQGILAYLNKASSSEAADIAGVPRAVFLQELMDRGITILDGPSTLRAQLEKLAELLGNERLAQAAAELAEEHT
jgi:predicted HTH domain antitoxin